MVVGTLTVRILIPGAHSLKDRRRVLKGLKDRIRNGFNVSVAEIDSTELWQRATLAIAMAGDDRRYINGALSELVNFLRVQPASQLVDYELEFLL
jgi:uncharacterized protein YlxP (DUF503 family)